MRATWYEQLGNAREVLKVGEVDIPEVGSGEVRLMKRWKAGEQSGIWLWRLFKQNSSAIAS